MSYSNGPRIISDGLVLCLDAGNSKSYSGSGNTWRNLASDNFNATMFGTVPYEIDTVPCWNFATASGTFSYNVNMGFTFAQNMVPTNTNFSVSFWVKNPNVGYSQIGLFSNTGAGNGYRFGVYDGGIYYLLGPTTTGGVNAGAIGFGSNCLSTLWYNVVVVVNKTSSQMLLYRNGLFTGSANLSPQIAFNNNAPGIVRSPCCSVYRGKLSSISVYNRSLTALEISQNYNTLKGRFGLS